MFPLLMRDKRMFYIRQFVPNACFVLAGSKPCLPVVSDDKGGITSHLSI